MRCPEHLTTEPPVMTTTLPVTCTMGAITASFDVPCNTTIGELGASLMAMDAWATTFVGPPPIKISVDACGAVMPMADFVEMAGSTCLGDVGALRLLMTPGIRAAVALHVVFDDESAAGIVNIDDSATATAILAALQLLFDGQVASSRVEFPSKLQGKWLELAGAFTDAAEHVLLRRVTAAVEAMPAFIRAPTPKGLADLRVKLAPGCSALAGLAPEPELPGTAADDAAAAEYSAAELGKMQKFIATSKSGGDDPAGRAWMAKLGAGLLTFAATNPDSAKKSKTGWYTCTLCTVTNQIDSAHGGTLRHVGGVSHVKKWLAANPQAELVF